MSIRPVGLVINRPIKIRENIFMSTYCFTDVGVLVCVRVRVTPITKGTPAQIFLGGMFLFSTALPLAFDFCYDLDLVSQGQAVRAFFIGMGFSQILSQVQGEF